MKDYARLYKSELLDNVVPFWMKYSKDAKNGGYYTSLDVKGRVFDRDKFMWLQAREVWMFSKLYNELSPKAEWKEMAKHGLDFILKNGRDIEGNFYFSLDEKGAPLVEAYNIFSDCFAAMALSEYSRIDKQEVYAKTTLEIFEAILRRQKNPKGKYNKRYPGTRDMKDFSLPMILCNLTLELEHLLDKSRVDLLARETVHQILNDFYDPEFGLMRENVPVKGGFSDTYEGRLTNPGHALEAMWFVMDVAERFEDESLIDQVINIGMKTLEWGWDQEYGGIYYFLDIQGLPSEKLEWNQKLWWVHLEALVFLAKAYQHTKREECLDWFEKVHQYAWKHFRDEENGEWFGYLDRYGDVLIPAKGGKWKGCFHVPRALLLIWKTFERFQGEKE
ncbi:AGE family epimerase/isomerase [Echinicola salinicaeni]|uniref:AGE family epimerase/isomerase n=1 Tax=Echinicola salinicaeni TaxID=2762757 RepID=UPI0016481D2B|nr:AGE family epimerase/isomerase [Echinicola salinicaeni]